MGAVKYYLEDQDINLEEASKMMQETLIEVRKDIQVSMIC